MSSQITTIYKKTTQALPVIIKSARDNFKSLGILTVNLGNELKTDIENFLENELIWLEYLQNKHTEMEEYLRDKFNRLLKWIEDWRTVESARAGSNSEKIQELRRVMRELKAGVLSCLLWRKPESQQSSQSPISLHAERDLYERMADSVMSAYPNARFQDAILYGKREFFKTRVWPPNVDRESLNIIFGKLNSDLHLFLENGINEIFWVEICKVLMLEENVKFTDLDRIFNYFWGSINNFKRMINRNYLYSLIEEGLVENMTCYSNLKLSRNTALNNYILKISKSPFQEFTGKDFYISLNGLEGSARYVGDQLITFGRDQVEEFTNDISIPNINGLDSIFAFIYTTHMGYHLVDISRRGTVRIKINHEEDELIFDDMIVILGRMHPFNLKLGNPILINGIQAPSLLISGVESAQHTKGKSTVINPGSKFQIGRHADNGFVLPHNDISEHHVEIEFVWGRGWILRDLGSTNGTFYKLKTSKEIEDSKPSQSKLLREYMVFVIENFNFIVLPETQ